MAWITKVQTDPAEDKVLFAPVSFPMIGLTQLMQLYVTAKTWDLSPADFAAHFSVAVGHSQGLLPAITASLVAHSDAAFVANVRYKPSPIVEV